MSPLPFPEVIDNTLRADFVRCQTLARYRHFEGFVAKEPSHDLHFGQCFAFGLAETRRAFFDRRAPERDALREGVAALRKKWGDFQPPAESVKTLDRCVGALYSYTGEYPFGTDQLTPVLAAGTNQHAIEQTFKIPLAILHPDGSGKPLYYGGRTDLVAANTSGTMWAVDEKTASRLGKQWRNYWRLDSQMTGYVWACRQQGMPVAGAWVRGIGIYKAEYGHDFAAVLRPQWQVDRWYSQMLRDVQRMIECWRTGEWNLAISKEICAVYSGCAFQGVCEAANPRMVLEDNFRVEYWNPLAGDEPTP